LKCTIIKHLGYQPVQDRHIYILEAENGLIAREEAQELYPIGTEFDLDDDAWSPDSEDYDIWCDGCGYEYTYRTIPGHSAICPVCGTEERIPENVD